MAMTRSIDPLVWIDCEMTGLEPSTDRILSISCYVTDYLLNVMEPNGYHATIRTSKAILDSMNEWCIKTHTASGLVAACQSESAVSEDEASVGLLAYVKKHVSQPRTALLAGNSVHADKMFLMCEPWKPLLEYFHYRIFDISAMKEAVRRWCSDEILLAAPVKKLVHSADEDIRESIEEAKYYMKLLRRSAP